MRIAVDTNILLRDALRDDAHQANLAKKTLGAAELIAISLTVLCEFVWVLRQGYKKQPSEIAKALRRLLNSTNVVTNRPAAEAGLAFLDQGGDFADGVIAYEGHWLGAEEFVSFDKQAVSLLKAQGKRARLLN